jgi:hypothetical protein
MLGGWMGDRVGDIGIRSGMWDDSGGGSGILGWGSGGGVDELL